MASSPSQSHSSTPTPDPESLFSFKVTSQFTFTVAAPTKAGSKAKPKDKKDVKSKEFVHAFRATEDAYITLLNTILSKHGQDKLKATARKQFGIKVLCAPQRAKGDAIDIDDFEEYKDLCKTVRTKKPSKITIFVNLADVRKMLKKSSAESDGSDDEGSAAETDDDKDRNGLTEYERQIARTRRLLEKKHQNDHDSGYTYVTPAGSLPLTPAMMKEWARSIYDGESTITQPPNNSMFDLTKRQAILNPLRLQAASPAPQPAAVSPIGSLSELSTFMTAVSQLVGAGASPRVTTADPSTPARSHVCEAFNMASPSSPPNPTPNKLVRFLKHAEDKLGVQMASLYEYSLRLHRYGPDILHLVDDKCLIDLGIPAGDVLRLKRGCIKWWGSADAKRARSDSLEADDSAIPPGKKPSHRSS
ncbi:hypothetical protein LshimejAT787_2200300 [Lyophyllum shimeji]|uniref:SAM domain-containing protein n=1 Tax=Lyophyllum shimeji TaxID=47721 RepID=A0A9P3PYF8_LYOSH|nr:hypothetical protein LshimejAT787_2200300 [Lyophyllum shimeji]